MCGESISEQAQPVKTNEALPDPPSNFLMRNTRVDQGAPVTPYFALGRGLFLFGEEREGLQVHIWSIIAMIWESSQHLSVSAPLLQDAVQRPQPLHRAAFISA